MNRKFSVILLIFSLLYLTAPAQEISTLKKVLWEEGVKLKWGDFLGEPPNEEEIGIMKAGTASEITLEGDFYEGDIPNFIIKSFFIYEESWTITDSNETLTHEQAHFDIAELYARKIRQRFCELQNVKELDSDIYIKEYRRLRQE